MNQPSSPAGVSAALLDLSRGKRWFVFVVLGWQYLMTAMLTLAWWQKPALRAMGGMIWGLNIFWMLGGGLLTLKWRDALRTRLVNFSHRPRLVSLGFATFLALLEEAVARLMTNAAPLFGVAPGQAYITASANYLDVVSMHSVVVFVPQFAAWAWLLSRFDFRPFTVFMLYGLTGTLNEVMFAGPQALISTAQWLFVYGLMVYLPAYCFPLLSGRRPVRWWVYPVALLWPIVSAIPVVLLLQVIAPGHPSIHFPPIAP